MDQKYGRKGQRRRSQAPVGTGSGSPSGSPYASPTPEIGGEPRGRSMQRFSGASPVASPIRATYPKSSPLARVNEENSTAIKVETAALPVEKLVEVETPIASGDKQSKTLEALLEPVSLDDDNKENAKGGDGNANSVELMNGNAKKAIVEDDTTMKTIEI